MIKKLVNKKCFSLIALILIITTIFHSTFVYADETQNTTVYVNPESQVVAKNENFNITINCSPAQPIKSFELKLSFDASLLQANEVLQGDIFNGFDTFFNSGVINNSDGTIINVYGLILGQGNVTDPGSFVTICFTAKNFSGISDLNMYYLGVTNETAYVPTSIVNGTVQIDGIPPEMVDYSPVLGYTGDGFTFSVNVTDNVDEPENLSVYVNWLHGSSSGNNTMTHTGNNIFEKTVTLNINSVSNLSYRFFTMDCHGNSNTSMIYTVTVFDNKAPSINVINASPGVQEVGGFVNITAQIIDNIGIAQVFLNITYPNSFYENISIINNNSNNVYFCNKTFSQYGTHNYFIWVDDLHGNNVKSLSNSFFIGDFSAPVISNIVLTTSSPIDTDPVFGWVNITCKVEDNVAVAFVYVNITKPNGSFCNISMNPNGLNYYYLNSSSVFSDSGNYSYKIESLDNDLNFVCSSVYNFSLPPNYDVNNDGSIDILDLLLISEVYGYFGNPGWIREDVDNNGVVQVFDMVIVSNYYGQGWW
ncbi:MAG: cohesin domain-containing protein [Candidatus Thermoplasmatota archaeon]|nr:cohesin domain-containing protein [Candidatus Thermoplasmatota archaeon]